MLLSFWGSKSEVRIMRAKLGRPTQNPLVNQATIRYDNDCKDILERYCKQENIGRNEAIRRGIKKLEPEIK